MVQSGPKHFSMIRSFHLADLLTIANGCCGIAAVFHAMRFMEHQEHEHLYFAVCGLSRLARYNITADELATASGAVRYFEGTPIPTSVVPLALLLLAFGRGQLFPVQVLGVQLHLGVLLFLLSGSLMISKTIRIPKP